MIDEPGTLGEVPAYVDKTAPIVEDELARLRALPKPSDHERVDAYLLKIDETLKSAREVGAAAARGDATEARSAGRRTQQLTREGVALAKQLGAEKCASQ